jgi:predicted ATPase
MRVALARHDALIRAAIVEHGGHVVKTMGDAFHAAFSRATDALEAALDAQRRLQAEPWGEIGPLRVRMALHTGAAEERDGDYYGPALNRAARLLAAGHGGQALLSLATCELVRDALPTDVSVIDLGEHRLQDLIRPERVFQVTGPGLPTAFPPLRPLEARPHNLPVHPTALLGRDEAVSEVRALFARGVRLVTLTGPGGTGKTRLSQQVAAELLDQLEDGVWLVELAPISDPALVPSTIAQALGLRDFGSNPALDVLREHLRGRSLLIVLDNYEQIIPAASVVSDLLAASPGLKVLVTSRESLRLRGEVEYAVQPLALPDTHITPTPASLSESAATALFVERAAAVRSGFAVTEANASAIAEVCRRLDGLPLAIELAAARVRLLTPEAIVSRLDRRLPLLTGGARDLPARQQTLRDTIAWSHDLLDEAERRLFRRLGVFVGGWTLEAAEALVGDGAGVIGDGEPVPWLPLALTDTLALGETDGAPDVLSGLDSLVAKSLVKLEEEAGVEPRFRMLETIREYALDQLTASGEETIIRRRHLAWCADLVVQGEWMSQSPTTAPGWNGWRWSMATQGPRSLGAWLIRRLPARRPDCGWPVRSNPSGSTGIR